MEKKQTAVEYLVEQLFKIHNNTTYVKEMNSESIIEQAKQIEKEQMKEAHLIADHYPRGYEFDKWYNETYGGKTD
jgi:hypothetical protein